MSCLQVLQILVCFDFIFIQNPYISSAQVPNNEKPQMFEIALYIL